MRAFVALALPVEVTAALAAVTAELAAGRPVPEENLHLTLAFLDDRDAGALEALDGELQMVTGPAPRLAITGLDVTRGGKTRLLWANVAPDEELMRLRKRVRGAARAAGIVLPHERFRPHVTLARFRGLASMAEEAALQRFLTGTGGFSLPAFTVRAFGLYRSTLMPDGAVYDLLAEYPLA